MAHSYGRAFFCRFESGRTAEALSWRILALESGLEAFNMVFYPARGYTGSMRHHATVYIYILYRYILIYIITQSNSGDNMR